MEPSFLAAKFHYFLKLANKEFEDSILLILQVPYTKVRIHKGGLMKKSGFLTVALLGFGCQPLDRVTPPSEYVGLIRTGYFEPEINSADWRTKFISRKNARMDLVFLDSLMTSHYAYNEADDLDETAVLHFIAEELPERMQIGDFAMQLQKALALSIDGHAPRIAGVNAVGERERIEDNPPGQHYFPFELRSTGSRIVAFDGVNRTMIDSEHPYVSAIDGSEVSEWIEAAQSIIVKGTPQLRWHRGARQLANIGFLRMEMNRGLSQAALVLFENEDGSSQVEKTVELVGISVEARERYPFVEDAVARVPGDIAYFRMRRMESDPDYISGFAQWIQGSRDALGAIVDIRDNGGGSRLPLLTLLPHLLSADAEPVVVNAGRLKLRPGCPGSGCETPEEGYLANRFMLPIRAIPKGTPQRAALEKWLPAFAPDWTPPEEGFSDWHYLIVEPDLEPVFAEKPVIILMNNGNFSASDIFLSALKGQEGVTLMGTASSGGSARQNEHILPGSDLAVRLASMASFQASNSRLYDGVGIEPDIHMEPEPGFFVNESDLILERAVRLIRESATGKDIGR